MTLSRPNIVANLLTTFGPLGSSGPGAGRLYGRKECLRPGGARAGSNGASTSAQGAPSEHSQENGNVLSGHSR